MNNIMSNLLKDEITESKEDVINMFKSKELDALINKIDIVPLRERMKQLLFEIRSKNSLDCFKYQKHLESIKTITHAWNNLKREVAYTFLYEDTNVNSIREWVDELFEVNTDVYKRYSKMINEVLDSVDAVVLTDNPTILLIACGVYRAGDLGHDMTIRHKIESTIIWRLFKETKQLKGNILFNKFVVINKQHPKLDVWLERENAFETLMHSINSYVNTYNECLDTIMLAKCIGIWKGEDMAIRRWFYEK